MAKQPTARFLHYMGPLVDALKKLGYSGRPKQVADVIQETVDVPPGDLTRKTKSGQSIFENDVHWCRAYLAKTGYIDSSKRGVWTLTPKGRTVSFDDSVVAEVFRTVQKDARKPADPSHLEEIEADEVNEIEQETQALEYRAQVLQKLKKLSPPGFEHFCRALLLEAGFQDVEVTGRSGDRGIDGRGILKVNPLFSMKVAFQAKRHQETVGPGVIRDFRGAIIGRADRGLVITTGTFTREAEIESTRDGATQIELIDGPAIVELMEEYEFGLTPVSTFRLDHDFFDKFEVQ